ncbi:putative ubiquitin activating E1 enzyme [Leishmania mexicana MHOM/GT/2001/U1103]|uniref:Ubiquitin-like modifier-activating enzyme ATG7 n=1 Tax=Leishmania mexicana (strain MHOM/GT/2001/U1103) TaxID=929439 RepID=E9AL10_LEIMU|nr:putative ubiquitin activating E1 enzyme [Leishmania mexicana MHOM/GT/2001/U1103]CBZ23613.1 putative ubiquitin activating E1 enzyme [Leishmania mexicana MHOM/GT/2001/U1103]
MSAVSGKPHLTFSDLQLSIDVGFWEQLRQLKLTEWRLEEPHASLAGVIRANVSDRVFLTPANLVHLSAGSLGPSTLTQVAADNAADVVSVQVQGTVKSFNFAEELNALNLRNALLSIVAKTLLGPAVALYASAEEEADAWGNMPFATLCMFTYIDAKAYSFFHWEAFPSTAIESAVLVDCLVLGASPALPFSADAAQAMHRHGTSLLRQKPERACNPFLAVCTNDSVEFISFSPTAFVTATATKGDSVVVCLFDFSDAVGSISLPVRNVITCLRLAVPSLTTLRLYALRSGGTEKSVFVKLEFDAIEESLVTSLRERLTGASFADLARVKWKEEFPSLKASGWRKKKIESLDLGAFINPVQRADSDSRFNLELMKWRVLPSLALDQIARCKALLLGTGTLGCNVARNLLMWGVRDLTLVDRGRVSFSNLARQSLFTFEAAKDGKTKVDAAAEAIRAIIPSAVVRPVPLTIHMPGHRIDEAKADKALGEIHRLEELIAESDVVFLLTDSREARWVPTIIAAATGTPVINVALGFDTYVVMRHGVPVQTSRSNAVGEDDCRDTLRTPLGCYFCSDIIAPTDSLSFRALDEQCTVTRPAVSSIASAIAVDLLAELYQHPSGFRCPAYREAATGESDQGRCRLGVIPQQIRGSVFSHTMHHLCGERNPFCTACADALLRAYKEGGSEFLLRCVNSPSFIEEVCGVKALKAKWEADMDATGWSSDEEWAD